MCYNWRSSNKIIFSQEEHEAIVRNRDNPDSRFTWEEYKSLTFTTLVILMLINSYCYYLKTGAIYGVSSFMLPDLN
jgi:hypothetical protein